MLRLCSLVLEAHPTLLAAKQSTQLTISVCGYSVAWATESQLFVQTYVAQ